MRNIFWGSHYNALFYNISIFYTKPELKIAQKVSSPSNKFAKLLDNRLFHCHVNFVRFEMEWLHSLRPRWHFAGVSSPFKFDWRFFVAEVTVADSDFLRLVVVTLKTREKLEKNAKKKINSQYVANINLWTLKIAFRAKLSINRRWQLHSSERKPSNDAASCGRKEFSVLALDTLRWKVACTFDNCVVLSSLFTFFVVFRVSGTLKIIPICISDTTACCSPSN